SSAASLTRPQGAGAASLAGPSTGGLAPKAKASAPLAQDDDGSDYSDNDFDDDDELPM
ncbi:unnamed protein product, partial [Symbiodinium natans]